MYPVTHPDNEIAPDSAVEPLSLERIGDIFKAQNLDFRFEEQPVGKGETVRILRTGFSNAAIAFQHRDNTLICDSIWRGDIPADKAPEVLATINQWNTNHFAPTLRFFEAAGKSLAISGFRELHVGAGVTRNQLGAFVMSSLNSILESFNWLEQQYPDLVTWEEHNHD